MTRDRVKRIKLVQFNSLINIKYYMSRARFCLLQLYSTATQQRINLISCAVQTNGFNLSYSNGDVSFTSIDFCCTLNVDFLCTNDE